MKYILVLFYLFYSFTTIFSEDNIFNPVVHQDNDIVDADHDGLIDINSIDELFYIRYNVRGDSYRIGFYDKNNKNGCPKHGCKGYELTRNLDFNDSKSYVNLGLKKVFENKTWNPIGDDIDPFQSIFEGNNYTIHNLNIQNNTISGLFGHTDSAIIRNLNLKNVSINVTSNLITELYVGTLVGSLTRSVISNCSIQGKINISSNIEDSDDRDDLDVYAGGITGVTEDSYINNSIVKINIISKINTNETNKYSVYNYVGGITGLITASTIENTVSINTLEANSIITSKVGNAFSYVGGLVGFMNKKSFIKNSFANSHLIAYANLLQPPMYHKKTAFSFITDLNKNYSLSIAGGLVGLFNSKCNIIDSFTLGSVKAKLAGAIIGMSTSEKDILINRVYWKSENVKSIIGNGKIYSKTIIESLSKFTIGTESSDVNLSKAFKTSERGDLPKVYKCAVDNKFICKNSFISTIVE